MYLILLKAKVGMLDSLLDIEVAYSLLKSGASDLAKDPLDVNYEKLQTDLEVHKLLIFPSRKSLRVTIFLAFLSRYVRRFCHAAYKQVFLKKEMELQK